MKILKKINKFIVPTLVLTLCSFTLAQPGMALLDSLTPQIVEIINKASQPEDAKKKICSKQGILRGSGLFAGNNCKKTVFAQLFKIMCSDDADAMKSKCADKASSATSKADIASLAAAFGKSAKAIGTDAEAILCKTPRNKLPLALKPLADNNCVATAVIAPVDMTKKSYNILSLDGGGIRGIGTLVLLSALEMKTGKKTYELFDMIIGTSTGGLIAIMLSEGKSASAILDFYVENGPLIFQRSASKKLRSVGGLLGTKYSAKQLELIIKENIGDKKLSDSAKPIGVTSYNVTKGEQQVLSSWDKTHSEKISGDAARATSAAPTYFKGKEIDGDLWVDGGVGANDPSTSAFAEAKRFFPEGAKLRVVSIG
ncbi:MAG: patatin-like phospholipase family protein, partial [Alphaproteobacteria bacterium]|nr:patatin-like phospholipase family protein [Alphaproteobacteria bacterium]